MLSKHKTGRLASADRPAARHFALAVIAAGLVLLAGLVAHHGDYDAGWLGIIPIFHALAHSISQLSPADSMDTGFPYASLNGARDVEVFTRDGTTYLVVAAYDEDTVQILDISNTSSIDVVDRVFDDPDTLLDRPTSVEHFIIDNTDYIAVGSYHNDAVQILNLADPPNTVPAGKFQDTWQHKLDRVYDLDIFTIGSHTYAATASDHSHGVQVLNLTDPENLDDLDWINDTSDTFIRNPRGIDTFTDPANPSHTYAVVTSHNNHGVQILNFTNLDNIDAVSRLGDNGDRALTGPIDVKVFTIDNEPNHVYAVVTSWSENGIQVINMTDISNVAAVAKLTDGGSRTLKDAHGLDIFTVSPSSSSEIFTYAVVTSHGDDGIQIVNITDPSSPGIVTAMRDDDFANLELDGPRAAQAFTKGGVTYLAIAASSDHGVQLVATNIHMDNRPPALRVSTAIVHEDTSEQLNAWAADPDGDTMTYNWTQKSPSTPRVAFDNHTILRPTVTGPDVSGDGSTTFILTLNATDQHGLSSTKDMQLAVWGNSRPTVDAGPDTRVREGDHVQLNGTASDNNNDPITYQWTYTPSIPPITLSNSTILNPTFTAPEVSADITYTFTLNATDHHGAYRTDTVDITVGNNRPPRVNIHINTLTTHDISPASNIRTSS